MNDFGLNSAGVQFALLLMQRTDELQRQVSGMVDRLGRMERRRRNTHDSPGTEGEA
jgi:hypothetical protein